MRLEDIAAQIEAEYRQWATEHVVALDRVATTPEVAARITHFIEEAIGHPSVITASPVRTAQQCLKLASLANFRMGLLIGLMLDRVYPDPTDPVLLPPLPQDDVVDECDACHRRGEICMRCLFAIDDCICGEDCDPVLCEACNGEGYKAK